MTDLSETAHSFFASGKGLLAADESIKSADKRLAFYGIPTGSEMREKDRNLFLETPGIEDHLSGVILFTETLPERGEDGALFPTLLASKGIQPGVKVDLGYEPFPESPKELITNGLLGLSERLIEYRDTYGTTFTKWRAEIRIDGTTLPSSRALVENAKRLALYAYEVQSAGMMPIVEPEVSLKGTHGRLRACEVLESALSTVVGEMRAHAVDLSGVIIKTSMVLSGSENDRRDTPEEVAEATLAALLAAVPKQIPGIVFLSGGQTPDQATDNLAAIVKLAREKQAPWPLTFSFARALQEEALHAWGGKDENIPLAREAFLARLKKVSRAVA